VYLGLFCVFWAVLADKEEKKELGEIFNDSCLAFSTRRATATSAKKCRRTQETAAGSSRSAA
jgi:hypothetical protein